MKPSKEEIIEAIDKLIEHYSNYNTAQRIPPPYGSTCHVSCPLCTVRWSCSICPWLIIENTYCRKAQYHKNTTKQRLKRLNRWKKLIEKGSYYE